MEANTLTDRPMTDPLPPDAFLLDPAKLSAPLDPYALFEREGLLEVELGFGKGSWLWRRAERFPERNLIGIEKTLQYVRKTRDRLVRHGVTNVRLVRTDAPHFFSKFIPDRSLHRVHVYFPDPWPKKRHAKRRLLQPPFLGELARTLRADGEVRIRTDHEDYYEQIEGLFRQDARFRIVSCGPLDYSQIPDEERTNYERKFLLRGKSPLGLLARLSG